VLLDITPFKKTLLLNFSPDSDRSLEFHFYPFKNSQNGEKRLKGVQFALPVVTGTIAFSLGKKVPMQI
jgi:hypothetical protein